METDEKTREILAELQREYFNTGVTRSLEFRLRMLKRLKSALIQWADEIDKALSEDLGQPFMETYSASIGDVMGNLNLTIKKLKKWMKKRRVPTFFLLKPGKSYLKPEPLGVSLIIGPWNYPFNLVLTPLVGAIAAGCTSVIKPSELTPSTAEVIKSMLESAFEDKYIAVRTGGVEVTTELLNQRFDKIFFTGSTRVGKIVMSRAAENLTPVTLELGGQCPAVIAADADLKKAARRIAFGKFYNAGQTCVAPNTVYIPRDKRDDFISILSKTIIEFYGEDPYDSADYGRIVSSRHLQRLNSLISGMKPAHGGRYIEDDLYLEPTVIADPPMDSALMQEEIFGPVLPVVSYDDYTQLIDNLARGEKPLAAYLFSGDRGKADEFELKISCGTFVVNDAISQLSNPELPFGGVGESGMGRYHGRESFLSFSHEKPAYRHREGADFSFKYPPYPEKTKQFLKNFFLK